MSSLFSVRIDMITNDGLNGEQKGVLFEVLTKGRALEFLHSILKNKSA